jgi:carbon starvation protein
MGVLVASFAGTTLDTACRLQRYVVQELAATFVRAAPGTVGGDRAGWHPAEMLVNKHGATIAAITLAALLAALPPVGQAWSWHTAGTGGLILWPMFGATNQLLGGLAFLVVGFWLWRRRLPVWFLVPPMLFMLVMPAWAMIWQLFVSNAGDQPGWIFQERPNLVLIVVAVATLALEIWMIVEALLLWPKVRGRLEAALPPLAPAAGVATGEGGRSC